MRQRLRFFGFAAATSVCTAACGAPLREAPAPDSNKEAVQSSAVGSKGKIVTTDQKQGAPINQRFRNLDDYLTHLERTQAPIDKPWYRQVRPGVYQLMSGNLRILPTEGESEREDARFFTREELERKYGFAK